MDATLSEASKPTSEPTHPPAGALSCSTSATEVSSLLTQILSTMQQTSGTSSLPNLPKLENALSLNLLSTLTSQGASLDLLSSSLLDSLTHSQGLLPPSTLCASTAGPSPSTVVPSRTTAGPALSLSGLPTVLPVSLGPSIPTSVKLPSGSVLPALPTAAPGLALLTSMSSSLPASAGHTHSTTSSSVAVGLKDSGLLPPPAVSSHPLTTSLPVAPPPPHPSLSTSAPIPFIATPLAASHTPLSAAGPTPSAASAGHTPSPAGHVSLATAAISHAPTSASLVSSTATCTPSTAGHTSLANSATSHAPSAASATSHTPSAASVTLATSHTPSAAGPTISAISHTPSATSHTPSTAGPAISAISHTSLAASHTPSAAGPTISAISHTPSAAGPTISAISHTPSGAGPTISAISHTPSAAGPTVSAGQALPLVPTTTSSSLAGAPPTSQPSPPSLQANEELLSDDESDEMEMDPANSTLPPSTIPPPHSGNAGSRSDSASPYTDDASFASFVAEEAHDSASAVDEEHFSPSPSPLPSVSQSIDALVSQLQNQPPSSSSQLAMQAQFGVTAYCPRNPSLLPEKAPQAPLDMTTHNFPKRSKYAHRAAMSALHPYHRTRGTSSGAGGGGVNVAKTLDLMKAVLQASFNMELKRLCDDYFSCFRQAATNIRENTGDDVPEATLRLLVCKMLEEAQQGYLKGQWEFPSGKLPKNEKLGPAKSSPMATKKVKADKGEPRYGPPKRTRRPPTDHHGEKTSWKWGMDKKRVDPLKWRPDQLSLDTTFVLGVNVNKALGHAANRGKVYYLHPELFKYACDGDDKTWLYENKFLPVHGGKAFLMIFKEVEFLVTTDECYKDNEDVYCAVKKLQEFHVPQFMLDKMKAFMRSVQGYFAQEASANHSHNSPVVSNQKP